jgi:hypothetical protein
MKRIASFGIVILILADSTLSQCNMIAIEKQQHEIAKHVSILHGNFLTFWLDTYPKGAPFPQRDGSAERRAAWSPAYKKPADGVVVMNDGLGCVTFIVPNGGKEIPDLCAPVDKQAQLAMEALREDWENSRQTDKATFLYSIRESIPMIWVEEKTLYCVVDPEASYIDLSDKLQSCTPNEKIK